jgi:hypothetical protein
VIPNSPLDDAVKGNTELCSPARHSYARALTSPTSRKAYLAFFITYTLIFLAPAVAICLPTPDEVEFGKGIFIGFTGRYHIPVVTILATARFKLAWQLRRKLGSTSLSTWTLGSQMIIFALLGISSRIRLGKIGIGFTHAWVICSLTEWYMMIGWRCVPYVVYSLGQAALFALLVYYRWKGAVGVTCNSEHTIGATTEYSPLLRGS